jgi:predicted AlkP superfamily phosphohydrolase/phosphomutase
METRVYTTDELYPVSIGDKPDLMVYFDDLFWRSAGTLGHNELYLPENDTGPDDAVHAQDGMFVLYDPDQKHGGQVSDLNILDIAPTLLTRLGLPVPPSMEGKTLRMDGSR